MHNKLGKRMLIIYQIKRLLLILSICILNFLCSSNYDVKRTYEEGVEVILNQIEPYKLKTESSSFELKTIITIDMEREDIVREGMGEAGEFDVDGEGNIYIIAFKNSKNFIYRFNKKGKLLNSFGKIGQGPGELSWPFLNHVFEDGRIAITDQRNKYVVFDKEGTLLKEIRPGYLFSYVYSLENGFILVQRPRYDEMTSKDSSVFHTLSLCDSNFKEIKELDRWKWNYNNDKLPPVFMWRVSAGHIYVANNKRDYNILDYNLEGNLQRIIRKDYRPVTVTEDIKKALLGQGYNQSSISQEQYFPTPLPPICSFFVDDEGRIFVMTYESGNNPGEYVFDLFNAHGIFFGRKSLNTGWTQFFSQINYTKIKKGCLYFYRLKENGYNVLYVQKIIWKKI